MMVSIIIPVYNKLELTINCVNSILNNSNNQIEYEIIISDDHSTDNTKEFFGNLNNENVRYRRNESNRGFAFTCNRGAEIAKGKYLLLLNNDCVLFKDILKYFLNTLFKYSNVGIVGGKLLYSDNTIQHAGVIIYPDKSISHLFKNFPSDYYYANIIREMDVVTGACLMIEKKLFTQLGMFDEIFLNGFEDIDLCFKAKKAGKKIIYNPEITLYHLEEQTRKIIKNKQDANNSEILSKRWHDNIPPSYFLKKEGFDFKLNDIGEFYLIKKDVNNIILENSENFLENIITKEPFCFEAYKKLIYLYIYKNKLDEAIEYCKKLIKIEPILDNLQLLYNLYKINKDKEKMAIVQKIIKDFDSKIFSQYLRIKNFADYYLQKNDLESCSYFIDWLINKGFANQEREIIEKYLKNIA